MDHFFLLKEKLASYLEEEQISQIEQAYLVAKKAHEGQTRSTGEPYITHPIAVADILADIKLDYQSIMAAILHDVIEDTPIKKADLVEKFGTAVADLVDGVSKLTQIKSESKIEAQAENLRKMMLAMSKDIRVILVKLADRLHNMRTLQHVNREKQKLKSIETLEIYAPIAHRLGINFLRVEFEDLGFAHLYPVRYKVIKEAVQKARGNRKEIIKTLENAVKKKLESENLIPKKIVGREKHLYSLYKKMKNKDLSLSDIMDVYALRMIVDDLDKCYRVLGYIHSIFKPVHGKFKDYIAVPKANGYQSLHTIVLGPHGLPVEIQIRTEQMDQMAESGIASHWLYKSDKDIKGDIATSRAREWLKGMLELQKSTGSSLEFIENVKVDLYPDAVYVFTPEGDILSLPNGATTVDFAYAVHSDVGNACVAAKIDRKLVPLSNKLSSGQTIEIITTESAHPNPAWLSFVMTGKARSHIRHWLKDQQQSESISLGKRLLERSLSSLSLSFENISRKKIDKLLKEMNLNKEERLFEEIGLGNQMAPLISRRLATDTSTQNLEYGELSALAIQGTEGMVISYAKCCYPIPGDQIIGFLSSGRGIVIHRDSCNNIHELKKNPEKYIFVQWSEKIKKEFKVELKVDVINKRGVLANVANCLSDCEANIENMIIDERDNRHNTLIFLLIIKDRIHLANVIRKVRTISVVTKVTRVK